MNAASRVLAATALVIAVGCNETPKETARAARSPAQTPAPWASRTTAAKGFPCDVDRALASSCRRCHWEPRENDAPFSMTTWDELQKISSGESLHKLMIQMMEADLMPPLDANVEPPVTPLAPEHKQALVAWLEAGAPRSDAQCP